MKWMNQTGPGNGLAGPGRWALLPTAMLLMAVAPLAGTSAVQGQEEDCNCEPFRIMTRGNVFSLMGDRPRLGVSLDMDLDRELDDVGVRIADVMEDGPAEAAGLLEGDVITSLDGRSLNEPLDRVQESRFDDDLSFPGQRLQVLVRELEEGEPVEVGLLRDGEALALTVTPEALDVLRLSGNVIPNVTRRLHDFRDELQDMDWQFDWQQGDGDLAVVAPRMGFGEGQGAFLSVFGRSAGIELVEVNEGLGRYFGTDRGVLVTEVDDGSELGLRAGDVILEIDGREVDSPGHFHRIMRSYDEDEPVEFTLMRDGNRLQVSGQPQ
ncbi:MAG: PDZ domain-containing protein [Gemmatimonadetes bacterium]|nr:PDZ domain-containing protein [Gemmatimonadota bacterium]NNM33694.1 PDZ domain-containing protein [Gemmatimonadota bacterium]